MFFVCTKIRQCNVERVSWYRIIKLSLLEVSSKIIQSKVRVGNFKHTKNVFIFPNKSAMFCLKVTYCIQKDYTNFNNKFWLLSLFILLFRILHSLKPPSLNWWGKNTAIKNRDIFLHNVLFILSTLVLGWREILSWGSQLERFIETPRFCRVKTE